MSLAVTYNENRKLINAIGTTLYLLALGVAAFIGTNYLYENVFTIPDNYATAVNGFVLATKITVVISLVVFAAQKWLGVLAPTVSYKIRRVLTSIAFMAAFCMPAFVILTSAYGDVVEPILKGDIANSLVTAGLLAFSLSLIYKLYKATLNINELLCETVLIAVSCLSFFLIVASIFIIAIAALPIVFCIAFMALLAMLRFG